MVHTREDDRLLLHARKPSSSIRVDSRHRETIKTISCNSVSGKGEYYQLKTKSYVTFALENSYFLEIDIIKQ